jgi:uncharacterized protein (UPF0332 family)
MSVLWTKAMPAAESAKILMEAGQWDGACNRAYYAMFNPARALLIEMHGFTPEQLRQHATVLRQFSLHFVGKHGFDADAGRMLRRAGDVRIVADYDEADVHAQRVRDTINAMERFIAAATVARTDKAP